MTSMLIENMIAEMKITVIAQNIRFSKNYSYSYYYKIYKYVKKTYINSFSWIVLN